MKNNYFSRRGGYALLLAIITINIMAILLLTARALWETEIQRDLEEELIFRGGQYVTAIELFKKKNNNMHPKNLKELYEKNFLRKEFTDPMSVSGKWNVVLQSATPGKQELMVVPEDRVESYTGISRGTRRQPARIVGVCSSSKEEGFREYRKKKRYYEWAFYVGQQIDKEMPTLKFVDGEDGEKDEKSLSRSSRELR